MAKLIQIRKSPAFQTAEDALGALILFVVLYAGLTLTGTA
jgi:hypothetical protein